MRNRYPGTCYRCGKPVAARDGHFERIRYQRNGKPENAPKWYPGAPAWRTQHAACAIAHRHLPEHAKGGAS